MPASGGMPKQLVIFVHGYGASGNDLIALAENIAEVLPDAAFLSPDAPTQCEMSPFGYQWFSLRSWTEEFITSGVERAERPDLFAGTGVFEDELPGSADRT